MNMKKLISFVTLAVALVVGLVFANDSMAATMNSNVNAYLTTGPLSLDDFAIGPPAVFETSSICSGGSSAGGLTAAVPGRKNGITYFSTGPAIFDGGPVGLDRGGSCVNSSPRQKNAGHWPEDYS